MAVGLAVLYFLLISSAFVLVTLLFCGIILIHDIHKKYKHIPGPGMLGFIFGNYGILNNNNKPKISKFQSLFDEFGVVVLTWRLYKPIVSFQEEYTFTDFFEQTDFKDALTYGELSTLFEERFVSRGAQLVYARNPTDSFNSTMAKRQLRNINHCCSVFVKMLESMATSEQRVEIKMAEQFDKLAVDIITKVVFGMSNCCMQDPDQPLYKALHECQNAMNMSMSNPFHKLDISSYEYQNDVVEAVKYLRDYGKKVIDRRRTDMENEERIEEDYLTWMIVASNRDSSITLDDMLDEFVALFISGQGQLTSLLSSILLELLRHPNIEEKAYEEYLNTVQSSNNQVSLEHFPELKLTSCILRETLRLHPPVLSVFAKMKATAYLYTFEIPEKTQIQMLPAIIQTNPKNWKEPQEFKPGRFADVNDVRISTLFPYALKNHNYVNGYFVECVVKAVLPHLLQRFKFVMKDEQDSEYVGEVYSVPKDGVLCSVSMI